MTKGLRPPLRLVTQHRFLRAAFLLRPATSSRAPVRLFFMPGSPFVVLRCGGLRFARTDVDAHAVMAYASHDADEYRISERPQRVTTPWPSLLMHILLDADDSVPSHSSRMLEPVVGRTMSTAERRGSSPDIWSLVVECGKERPSPVAQTREHQALNMSMPSQLSFILISLVRRLHGDGSVHGRLFPAARTPAVIPELPARPAP